MDQQQGGKQKRKLGTAWLDKVMGEADRRCQWESTINKRWRAIERNWSLCWAVLQAVFCRRERRLLGHNSHRSQGHASLLGNNQINKSPRVLPQQRGGTRSFRQMHKKYWWMEQESHTSTLAACSAALVVTMCILSVESRFTRSNGAGKKSVFLNIFYVYLCLTYINNPSSLIQMSKSVRQSRAHYCDVPVEQVRE